MRRACSIGPGRRWPVERNRCGIGHAVLAIQDLTEGGHQPMLAALWCLRYNGEIYNHEQLRQRLPGPWHSTATPKLYYICSITAVPPSAASRGHVCVCALDTAAQRLLLARDRLGIKPLYYQILRTALPSHRTQSAVDSRSTDGRPQRRSRLLFHGYVPAPKTIFQGISKLPAAIRSPGRQAGCASSGIGSRPRRS